MKFILAIVLFALVDTHVHADSHAATSGSGSGSGWLPVSTCAETYCANEIADFKKANPTLTEAVPSTAAAFKTNKKLTGTKEIQTCMDKAGCGSAAGLTVGFAAVIAVVMQMM